MSPQMRMGKPTSPKPKHLYPLYIFPPSASASSGIKSKISVNIKTLIHSVTIPNITKIILTLLPRAKALLLRFSKEANTRLPIPTNSIKMLISLLDSIDITAFVNGFIIPCLKNLMEFVMGWPRRRTCAMVRRLRLSFSKKFKYMIKRSTSSSYFRFHYNWSSRSFILPVPATVLAGGRSNSYQSLTVNDKNNGDHSIMSCNLDEEGNEECHDSLLNGYLEWLEQGGQGQDPLGRDSSTYIMSDVDMLAEKFIEEKYEMFVLEKLESERMFQEMMARSL